MAYSTHCLPVLPSGTREHPWHWPLLGAHLLLLKPYNLKVSD